MADQILNGVEKEVKSIVSFGTSHLILIVLLALTLVGSVYLWDSKRSDLADAKASAAVLQAQQADQKAKTADQQNQALQASTLAQIQALTTSNRSLQAQVSSLASAIAKRDSDLAAQQKAVVAMTPTALSTAWGSAAKEPAPVVNPDGNFLASLPLAQKSLEAFNSVSVLTADNRDLTDTVSVQKNVISNDGLAFAAEVKAHSGDVTVCTADKAALNADKAALVAENKKIKVDARKSKIKWALGGVVTGAVTVLIHFL